MATKPATPAVETPAVETPAAPHTPGLFVVDETKLKVGRKVVTSAYFADVQDAEEGKAYGIPVADKAAGTTALNELRKAAQQTGRKLRTWNKSTETPAYVAFKVVPAVAPDAPAVPVEVPAETV